MDEWSEIRRRVLVEGVSRRQILRERKMHWRTLKKILEHSEPTGYQQQKPRVKRKLGDYLVRIEQILREDPSVPITSQKQLATSTVGAVVVIAASMSVVPLTATPAPVSKPGPRQGIQ
jgi:hypothetical protein